MHSCRSLLDTAAASAESTPEFRNLRLVEEEGGFAEVETKTKYLDVPSLFPSFGLNSIADGPDRPKRIAQTLENDD